ncbi:MAG: zinc ABC transporter substrate-binding protein [Bacilli bacterium]|nr:zinc ABC transporter substrate-binding protein [Bacilli bacterium]
MKKLIIFLSFLFLVTLTACDKNDNENENVVYVTVYPMQYLVEAIAGDTVIVKRVPGSTVHSESIDWSAKEIIDMINADILFYVNAGVDTYIPDNANSTFKDANVNLIDLSQHISYNEICFTDEHNHASTAYVEEEPTVCDENSLSPDPHFWLDPVRMLQAAELVKDKLIVEYPENQALFENNFTVLNAALEKLNDDFQEMADNAIKPLITTVMLFSYWHDRYDLEILSISNTLHTSEEIPGDIIHFVDEATYHFVHYILFETNVNSPAGNQVLQQLSLIDPTASALYLHGLGNLTTDEVASGANYISIMYDNLNALNLASK